MRRRDFITLLGGAGATWLLAARAQQAGKPPTIGFPIPSSPAAFASRNAAFHQGLKESA